MDDQLPAPLALLQYTLTSQVEMMRALLAELPPDDELITGLFEEMDLCYSQMRKMVTGMVGWEHVLINHFDELVYQLKMDRLLLINKIHCTE
jgi:hypothetical protein